MYDNLKQYWLVNGLLAVILVLLVGNYNSNHSTPSAQAAGPGWSTDGVMLGTTNADERLVMVDTVKQNIMLYRSRGNTGIGLSGVRSYKYDIEIEDTEKQNLGQGWTMIESLARYMESQK